MTHEWQAKGTDLTIVKDTSKVPILQKEFYCHVDAKYREITAQVLKECEFQPLTDNQVMLWCSNFKRPEDSTLKPYLVRGVVYGLPWYTIVRFDENTGELISYHATYNGENSFMEWMMRKPYPWPLVVYLPLPPKAVFSTAELCGDAIFRGRDFETLDRRPLVQDSNESPDLLKRER